MAPTQGFTRSLAVVIGVNKYINDVPLLRTAVSDAERLASALEKDHGYEVWLLTNEAAGLASLRQLLSEKLPAAVGAADRLIFYFAGHGIAMDGDDGPVGYLIPQDARRDDPTTFLKMTELHASISGLNCRHLLVLLDCCFAGAFRWSSTRHFQLLPAVIHRERYARYLADEAWQVITSAAHNQEARDVVAGSPIGKRGSVGEHSPFAQALFDALRGEADLVPVARDGQPAGDGVITATELYTYLRDRIERESIQDCEETLRQRQTPGLWLLNQHRGGEYIFLVPGHSPDLPPAPELSLEANPYRGLSIYEMTHRELFFGRERAIEELSAKLATEPLVVVLGASGSGKSSLVQAGLMPRLSEADDAGWYVLPAFQPLADPLKNLINLLRSDAEFGPVLAAHACAKPDGNPASLADSIGSWRVAHPKRKLLLVVDQFEQLITLGHDNESEVVRFQEQLRDALRAHAEQLRVVLTLRSDFEPYFTGPGAKLSWQQDARFVVKPMSRAELREVVLKPAEARVLYFDPPELVDRMVDEVAEMPGALPLLSFTLSELYAKYISRRRDERALTEDDYNELGGVAGSLRKRASDEYERLDEPHRVAMRAVLRRMVAVEGRELTRRRVPKSELVFAEPDVNEHVDEVMTRLSEARLISEGQEYDDEPYAEPAHDALVAAWDTLRMWIREERETLPLQRRLSEAARDWAGDRKPGRLWDDDPRLPQVIQLADVRAKLNLMEKDFVSHSVMRATRRRRWREGGAAFAFIVMTVVAVVFYVQRNNAIRQQFISLAQRLAAESFNQEAQNRQDERAALLAVQAFRFNQRHNGSALSQVEAALRAATGVENFSNILLGTEGTQDVRAIVFSPDGHWLAAGSQNGYILLWDLTRRGVVPLKFHGHEDFVSALAFSPDSRTLASASRDKTVKLWNVSEPELDHQTLSDDTSFEWGFTCLAFSHDGGRLAAGNADDTIRIWELNRKKDPAILWNFGGTPSVIVFSSDGQRLACGTNDAALGVAGVRIGKVSFWELAGKPGKPTASHDHDSAVVALKFGDDNHTLVVLGTGTQPAVWDTARPQQYTKYPGFPEMNETITSGTFSADTMKWVMGSKGGVVRIWNFKADPEVLLRGHRAEVNSVALSPDGKFVASAGDDQIIRLWSLEAPSSVPVRFRDRAFRQLSVVFEPDGRSLLSGDSEGVWRWQSDRSANVAESLNKFNLLAVGVVAFSKDRKRFAVTSDLAFNSLDPFSCEVDVIDRDGKAITLKGHSGTVKAIAFVPDTRIVATGGLDQTIRLWDLGEPNPSASPIELKGNAGEVSALATSPDGRLLAAGYTKTTNYNDFSFRPPRTVRTIYLWDLLNTKKSPIILGSHDGEITSLQFSFDSRFLASGSEDRTTRVWDISRPGVTPLILRGHDQTVKAIAFRQDGRALVTGSYDGTTRLWDLDQPEDAPLIWNSNNGEVITVAFSPDGNSVASGYMNGTILVWAADPASITAAACRKLRRNLTIIEWRQFVGAGVPYEKTCEELPAGT